MIKNKLAISSQKLIFIGAIYFAFALNLSFWRYATTNLEVTSFSVALFSASLPLVMFTLAYIAMSILICPYIGKSLIILLLCLSSITNYLMYQYGIYIDAGMVGNLFGTHPQEALDLITMSSVIWFVASGLIPSILLLATKITYKNIFKELKVRAVTALICVLLSVILLAVTFKEYASFGRNHSEVRRLINTGNYIYATARYFYKLKKAQQPFVYIDPQVLHVPLADPSPTVFILVVGETARAQNFSLNGYERNTNPLLSKQNIVNFPNVSSSGTATAVSLPSMFSHLPRKKFKVEDANYTDNLMDLLQSSDYDVSWKENDGGCKGVCDRVPTENMTNSGSQYCTDGVCFDQVLLENLESHLKGVTKDTFIVLHTMGSHGPSYYKRYPDEFKVFTPTCDTAEIQNCPRENILNTYDNTILYTDFIVSSAIDILKKFSNFESGLLYVSDHGESLGENNIYLHGMPYAIAPKEQTQVPMLLWMSEKMKKYDHINYDCLQTNAQNKQYSHDNLFHSILGLMEIESSTYQADLDMFKECRQDSFAEAAFKEKALPLQTPIQKK